MNGEISIEQISLGSVKRYLSAVGWQRRMLASGIELFTYTVENDSVEIVLPSTAAARDVRERLAAAVSTLMAFEQRTFVEIVAAIRAISYDLVRSMLPDMAIRHDTIRLGTAEEFIKRMTRIFAASAHSELHTGRCFARVDGLAQRYASEECRFGHTFRGSFGFTVESPVGPNTPEADGAPTPVPPLQRRAVQRLARGLRIVESAVHAEDPGQIVAAYERGLNANACDDLASLVDEPQVGEIRFDIIFSPEWTLPEDLSGYHRQIKIGHARSVDILREAAKELKIVHEQRQRTIVGYVRTLHSLENPSDLFSNTRPRDVIVEWTSEEFGRKNVRVTLEPEEYLRAIEAHGSGRQVTVFGELIQGPRQWRLEDPQGFLVL